MENKITKKELVEKIYENTNLQKSDISVVIDSFFEEIKDGLCEGKIIELRNFGTFEPRLRKEKKSARNPKTGEKVSVEAHYVAAFRAGLELKEKLWKLNTK